MKKLICIIILIIALAGVNFNIYGVRDAINDNTKVDNDVVESISNKIIRFHVIANSDKIEDQELKIKVRDRVLEFISPKLKNSNSIEESREILMNYDKEIREIAIDTIKQNGYDYTVDTMLSKESFPVKVYGNITLPPGKYEAYRIIIGTGKGQNWWCVMFPPLCFVDITKGEAANKANESQMKKVLNEKEYSAINNTNAVSSKKNDVKVKFKLQEIIRNLKK